MENEEEPWSDERVEEAQELAGSLSKLSDDVEELPESEEEANDIVRSGAEEEAMSLATQVDRGVLTEDQMAAAIMLGKGLQFSRVADALGVDESQIHMWNQSSERQGREFRSMCNYWRGVTEEEHFGKAMREINELADELEDDRDRLRLIEIRLRLAQRPEEREKWKAEFELKKRQVEATEDAVEEAGSPFETPSSAEMIDVEIEG